jgi:hypothetical protein
MVFTSTAASPSLARTRMPLSPSCTSTRASRQLRHHGLQVIGASPCDAHVPRVMAPATMYGPGLDAVGNHVCSAPARSGRPSMVHLGGSRAAHVDAHALRAACARQSFSGSRAAFSMTVVPSAERPPS